MKLLVYTSLFPNCVEPHHGVFVATRLRRYLARHGGSAAVVAPVPRAPPLGPRRWVDWSAVPVREDARGLSVAHPRYWSPPGFGDRWRAALLARGTARCTADVARRLQPDVLDVHYAYPDGVAAARLRTRLERVLGRRLPLVLTCRGTDLNLLPTLPGVRPQIQALLRRADHVVCVSEALAEIARDLGAEPSRVSTLRNGVDLERFAPGDRAQARRRLGLPSDARLLLCVGHLTERKGQHLLLPAFARTLAAPWQLVLVGKGERRASLESQARAAGLAARVRFAGAVPPEELPDWYRAADALALPSSREGWPNVVLESLACGTPVVATEVWGTPEILRGCPAARLVAPSEEGLAQGLAALPTLAAEAARPWAERFTWEPTLDALAAVFARVTAGRS